MYISNSSLLPFGWTAETLLETHSSKPFNPDIARVFYRAGYIESWGRGIQKICDACKNLGADEPVYIVHGEDIMVKFRAAQNAKVANPKAPKGHSEPMDEPIGRPLEEQMLQLIRNAPSCTYDALAESLKVSRSTVKRTMKLLARQGKIERVGGRRYGYWKIHG